MNNKFVLEPIAYICFKCLSSCSQFNTYCEITEQEKSIRRDLHNIKIKLAGVVLRKYTVVKDVFKTKFTRNNTAENTTKQIETNVKTIYYYSLPEYHKYIINKSIEDLLLGYRIDVVDNDKLYGYTLLHEYTLKDSGRNIYVLQYTVEQL
jgi:hypothetical protein